MAVLMRGIMIIRLLRNIQKRRAAAAITCLLLAMAAISRLPASEPVNEYRVKAAFLYHFASFVEWPPVSSNGQAGPLTICILGDDPFGRFLDDAVEGKSVEGRPVAASRISDIRGAADCRILFISQSERSHMTSVLASVSRPGLLTVGETPDFVTRGGIIGFRVENENVRLEVNLDGADKAKLKISSRLLSLAKVVRSPR